MEKITIGIIGLGFVGGAVQKYFLNEGYIVLGYDKFKSSKSKEALKNADIIFLCLPTPYKNNHIDLSALDETFEWLPTGKIIVIKSTVPPGTTDYYANKYNGIVFFNPEFLDSSKAEYDFMFPQRQIIGYTEKARNTGEGVEEYWLLEKILPKANYLFRMTAQQAETVKYMGNTFMIMKNVFANMWYDYCEKNLIDYESIREAVGADERIGHVHLQPIHRGKRGASGSCLPKDIAATIDFMDTDNSLLQLIRSLNDSRLKEHHKLDFGGMYDL